MKLAQLAAAGLLSFTLGVAGPALADVSRGWKAYLASDYATAWRELKPLAEADDAQAQYYLGTMYNHGHGAPRDARLAAHGTRKRLAVGTPMRRSHSAFSCTTEPRVSRRIRPLRHHGSIGPRTRETPLLSTSSQTCT